MINHFKGLWPLAALLFIVSCGGGGSGGGNLGAFTMTTTSVTFEADVEGPQPNAKSLTGKVTNAKGTLYVYAILSDSGVIKNATIDINGDTGELVLTPVHPGDLGSGTHSDTVTVSVCSDFNCNSHLNGSPKTINVTYRVTPLTSQTIMATVSTGGGFTEASGLIQCSESCQKLIYGESGDQIWLWPQERPGYVFNGWSGDCTPDPETSSCTFSFQADGVVEVTANFAPSSDTFELCPGAAEDTFSGNGRVSLAKVNDLIPLCNGYAILAMDDMGVVVRDLVNETDLETYQVSSIAYKLALDEENRFLYATHFDERKISRINLATGTVSELYYRGEENFEPMQSESSPSPAIAVTDEGTLLAPDYSTSFVAERAYLYDSATGMYLKASGRILYGRYKYIDPAGGVLTSFSAIWHFYLFNADTQSFTLRSQGSIGGTACDDVIISPDGMHVAILCSDSGVGHKIYDWDGVNSSSFNNIKLGEWDVGFAMADGSFSPSSESVVFTGDVYAGIGEYYSESIQLFSVLDHEEIWPTVIVERLSDCTSQKAFISTDEKLVYSLSECSSGSSTLTWVSIADPE